ncbi:hypothetical protein CHN51_19355 (plasmid) [Sphingorhabdus sp. YGSMI21]|nr:hypothetical protein CHN51_19355 [Sphingorhabdus sp. YGSMI21]
MLEILKDEMDRRFKAQEPSMERDGAGSWTIASFAKSAIFRLRLRSEILELPIQYTQSDQSSHHR